jgi:uncharacterized protein (TIGR02466 family)
MKEVEIIPLFATPIYVFKDDTNITFEKELEFIKKLDYRYSSEFVNFSVDSHLLECKEMERCKKIIEEHLKIYTTEVLSIKQEFYVTNCWIAKSSPGQRHKKHYHPNSIISGILYLNADENHSTLDFHKQSALRDGFNFTYDIKDFNVFNANDWSVKVKTGDVVIFPSNVIHGVDANCATTDRVLLGFNTFIKGTFGDGGYGADLTLT